MTVESMTEIEFLKSNLETLALAVVILGTEQRNVLNRLRGIDPSNKWVLDHDAVREEMRKDG